VTDDATQQVDAFDTPGSMLRSARLEQGISEREAADRLNLMPDYVGILERDDYQALRSPPFARGYVRLYGRLLGLDERTLLEAFDRLRHSNEAMEQEKKIRSRPMQLQHTGRGGLIGLAVLLLLVLAMWWWRGESVDTNGDAVNATIKQGQEEMTDPVAIGEP
jgi:cytoskeleton protein RodZ